MALGSDWKNECTLNGRLLFLSTTPTTIGPVQKASGNAPVETIHDHDSWWCGASPSSTAPLGACVDPESRKLGTSGQQVGDCGWSFIIDLKSARLRPVAIQVSRPIESQLRASERASERQTRASIHQQPIRVYRTNKRSSKSQVL